VAKFIISPEAQKSLKNIKIYSIKNFGTKRTKLYLQSIHERFHQLAENPSLGIIRKDLSLGYYSNFVGSHTIYYRVKHTCLEIIDILHQSMEPTKHIVNINLK